jgi:hypothetical protein
MSDAPREATSSGAVGDLRRLLHALNNELLVVGMHCRSLAETLSNPTDVEDARSALAAAGAASDTCREIRALVMRLAETPRDPNATGAPDRPAPE